MSIAFDARPLHGPLTGVGAWLSHVAGGLADAGADIALAASKPIDLPPALERPAGVTIWPPPRAPLPGTIWLNTILPAELRRQHAEAFVGSLAIVPRRCPVPAVAVVHDLTPRTLPSRHTLANRFCFNAYVEESLERADAVVAVSAATATAIAEAFPRAAAKTTVIANGVDRRFSPPPPGWEGDGVRARFADGDRFVLHLGTIEPRKGIVHLVDAWERLAALVPSPPALVVAGGPGWATGPILARIAASPLRARIHLPGYVSDADALALLRAADAFVLASEAEGFGLPLAEALACRTPVVATAIPAAREVAGDAALFVPVGDAEALADALARALEPANAAELRARAGERAPALRWDRAVDAWRELLAEIV